MVAYKVLRKDRNGLTSVSQHHPHTFTPGEVTVSTEAPIFVFDDLAGARIFAQYRFTDQLWQVEVDYLWYIPRIIHSMEPRLNDPESVKSWWRNELELKTMPVPLHTRVAPAIKLLKLIK
jgi:hypothetical protein